MRSSPLFRMIVPAEPRYFPGQRWLNIVLRSLHLVGVAGIGGGFMFNLAEAQWLPFWQLTLITGTVLTAIYVWATALWLVQLKGLVIVFKLLLLWIAMHNVEWRAELFVAVIVLSSVIAHAPGAVRGYVPAGRDGGSGCS